MSNSPQSNGQPSANLDTWLQRPVDEDCLLLEYWKLNPTTNNIDELRVACRNYTWQYNQRCEQLSANRLGKLKHQDGIYALSLILEGNTKGKCLSQLQQSFLSSHQNGQVKAEEYARELLDFVSKSLLMIDSQGWAEDATFEAFLRQTEFSASQQETKATLSKRHFHAQNLRRIAGLQIIWTDILTEHLLLDEDSKVLRIFKHFDALDLLKARNLIKDAFIIETARTYCVLMPYINSSVERWFTKQRHKHGLSQSLMPNRSLSAEERKLKSFHVWRDRLLILKDHYDEHEPDSFLENVFDDRKPARRWAFAIAIMIFIFTLAQVIGTVLQVYKAFNPSPA